MRRESDTRRLIDADMLIKSMYEDGCFSLTVADEATKKINEQPTAYDVEAVVAELKNKMLESSSAQTEAIIGMCGASANYYCGEKDAYENAVAIVRNGGKE